MKRATLFCIALAAIAAAIFWQWPAGKTATPWARDRAEGASGVDAPAEERHWRERLSAVGADAAYQEFKRAYADRHFSDQHIAAHVMGALLYRELGVAGLRTCDEAFAFGCYHSFFGTALAEIGPDGIRDFDRQCIEQFGPYGTGCQHGIGHGIMEYVGPRRIDDALRLCEGTTVVHPLLGCTSGVFMEYNTPIAIGTTASQTLREIDPGNPLAPCPALAERFRASCYFELAPWWKNFFDYEAIGRLCAELAAPGEREACLLGIGHIIAPFTAYDLTASRRECRRMPTEDDEVLCRAGLYWGYFIVPERRPLAEGACTELKPDERSRCLTRGRLVP